MKKFLLLIVLATVVIIVGGAFFLSSKERVTDIPTNSELPEAYEYYWGDGCPHCANVADFLDKWEYASQVEVVKKEVWYNKANANDMKARAAYCNLDQSGLAVPFLFTPEGKCLIGEVEIIDEFKSLEGSL